MLFVELKFVMTYCILFLQKYGEFEEFLERISSSIDSLLDSQPVHLPTAIHGTFLEKFASLSGYTSLAKSCMYDFSSFTLPKMSRSY